MRRHRVFGPAVAAVWLIYCPVAASGTKLAPVQEPLPEIFGTLDWKMSAEDIKARFPRGKIRNDIPGWDGKEATTVTMVSKVTWGAQGAVVVNFARDNHNRIRWIGFETTELNYAACEAGPRQAGVICRNDYGPPLLNILSKVKGSLSKAYGPPKERKGRQSDSPSDAREVSYKWVRKGFDVHLSMTIAEDDSWAVGLFATRQVQLPR